MIVENLKGKVVDIDNAFLNGDLRHEIYMKIPEGYDEVINPRVDKEDCLILQKAIFGLVQAARQFWKKIVDKMQEGGFKLSEADPCMLYKEDEKGVCIIIIYIDDMLIIGKEEAIDDAIRVLQGHFQVKDPTSLEDYLGAQIVQSDDGKKAWLGQPTIIKSLEKQFGEKVAKKKMTITPVKEIKSLYQMLRSMEIKVPIPIKVQVDNVGAIWLANNSSVSERTKHVDLRAHFVRDMIKDKVIGINFVKSAKNDSDIMTESARATLQVCKI